METQNTSENYKKVQKERIVFNILSGVLYITFFAGAIRMVEFLSLGSNTGILTMLTGINFYGMIIFSFMYLVHEKYEENKKSRGVLKTAIILSIILTIINFIIGYFEFINKPW